jgi:hypothetical protein
VLNNKCVNLYRYVAAHAHRPTQSAEAHDLLIGLANGEVVSTSLRALIADGGGGGNTTAAGRRALPAVGGCTS